MKDEKRFLSIEDILNINPQENKYAQWGIEFNPFPRSGTSNINGSTDVNCRLAPLNESVQQEINRFFFDALSPNKVDPTDKFLTLTIVGDYGSGKTQLLLYAMAILNRLGDSQKFIKPCTIYVDNPGVSVLEFLGNIIAKVGEENLRKYIWNSIIEKIKSDDDIKNKLNPYAPAQDLLFGGSFKEEYNPYSDINTTSYKKFLDAFIRQLKSGQKHKFDDVLSEILMTILANPSQTGDSTVARYFYEFISSDFGVNKTWEALINGNLKQIAGKESQVIKYIIKLLKKEGYTDVFIFVDEFEDITEGRLTKVQLDNYIHNLRTLLDKNREWCLLFAMNPLAIERLKSVSPPLADRIIVRRIDLDNFNEEEIKNLLNVYWSMTKSSNSCPFTDDAISYIRDITDGNARRVLKTAFAIFESAANQRVMNIDKLFVEQNIPLV